MLYIIGTPIGNLKDLSYRAAKILSTSDIILAEDSRSAQTLLYAIPTLFPGMGGNAYMRSLEIISYYKEKEMDELPRIMEWLREGKAVSLISEAGMPLVSDPGYLLMKSVIREGLPYTVIPGPSAVTTALVHAGFKTDEFLFLGFLPKKETHRVVLIKKLHTVQMLFSDLAFVTFESPHRIESTLNILRKEAPQCTVVVARELTKKFEEIIRVQTSEKNEQWKGEITLVMTGF